MNMIEKSVRTSSLCGFIVVVLVLQTASRVLGQTGHFEANFIRWKKLHIQKSKISIPSNRYLLSSSVSSSSAHGRSDAIILSEVSTVRKCGMDGDDRFPSIDEHPNKACPSILSLLVPNIEACAAKCAVERTDCRSWSFNKVTKSCTLFSQVIRSRYNEGYISGDVDLPLTVMLDGTVSDTGGFVCSCLQNPKSIYVSPPHNHHHPHHNQSKENVPIFPKKSKINTRSKTCMQQMGCNSRKDKPPTRSSKCSGGDAKSGDSTLITIAQRFGAAHFHFIIESLVRLATVPREIFHRKNLKIHIVQDKKASSDSSWQYELLSIFGISKQNVVGGEVFANEVFVPSFTSCGGPSRHQVLSLRNILLNSPRLLPKTSDSFRNDSIGGGGGDGIVVVLIERTVSRGLLNMDELRAELTSLSLELGFTLQVYSDHAEATKHNQFTLLSMFSQASIIVAPHGAGLSNMIVSQPCSTIIEARESVHPKCYDHLAQTLGFKYFSGCNFIKRDGVLDNACVSGKGQHVSYQHGLLTAGVNGSIEVNGIGQSLVEVEGGSEGRKKGDNVKVKIAVTQEVSMTVIDIKHTIGLVKREVVWRKEVNSTDANSYSHCIRNAREYYSSFIDSTGVASFDGNKEERDHYSGNVLNWTVPNGPKFAKFLKEKKLN